MRVTNFLPEEFRAARVAAKWSQERLAEQLGVDRTMIAHWESGRRSPDVDVLDASEVLFGVSAGSLRGAPEVAASEGLGALRLGRSLSQAEVAERLGLSRSGYAGIERGEFRISAVQASRLAEVLGVDVAVVTEATTVNWAKGDRRRGSKLERRRGRRRELAGERAKSPGRPRRASAGGQLEDGAGREGSGGAG